MVALITKNNAPAVIATNAPTATTPMSWLTKLVGAPAVEEALLPEAV